MSIGGIALRKLFTYLQPHFLRMVLGLLVKVLGTFMDLGLPYVLAYILDDVIKMEDIRVLLIWGGVMVLLSIGARTFNIIANRMASKVARDTVEVLRNDLFAKIQSLSGAQVDEFTIPSLETRLTSDTYNIHHMVGMMQGLGVRAPILLIGGIVLTISLEPVLAMVLLGTIPFLATVVYSVSKKGIPLYTKLQLSIDRLVRVVRENISGVRVIKALSKTQYEKQRFHQVNMEVSEEERVAGMTMAITNPSMNLLLNVGLTAVIIVGAYRVNAGASEPGKIVAFLSYFAIILQAVMSISRIFVVYSKAAASANRIQEVLDAPEDLQQVDIPVEDSENHIEFRNVSFSYTEEPCIENISFNLKQGESLGIIGSTGAGKTTLINLLMRFYDVNEGSILINGKDVRSFNKQELRKKFGVVFQNDVLFMDKVGENISLGRDISIEQMAAAAKHAQAAEFIDKLDGKFDFPLAIKGVI